MLHAALLCAVRACEKAATAAKQARRLISCVNCACAPAPVLPQAKKNVVSGKVFEAHEEVLKHQRTMESKEQQLQQLQAALHQRDQQHARELLQRDQENEQLRRLLEEARSGAGGSPATVHAPAAAAAAKQRTRLQLPIQQMLAQQAAEAEAFAKAEREAAAAAAAEEAADAGESAAARSREASSSGAAREVSSGGVADEPSSTAVFAQEEEGTDSPAAAAGAGLSRVDKSPLRDQDECTPLPVSSDVTCLLHHMVAHARAWAVPLLAPLPWEHCLQCWTAYAEPASWVLLDIMLIV